MSSVENTNESKDRSTRRLSSSEIDSGYTRDHPALLPIGPFVGGELYACHGERKSFGGRDKMRAGFVKEPYPGCLSKHVKRLLSTKWTFTISSALSGIRSVDMT